MRDTAMKPKPSERQRCYGRTDHKVALAYMAKGWKPFANREAWANAVCRYHEKFELPKEKS